MHHLIQKTLRIPAVQALIGLGAVVTTYLYGVFLCVYVPGAAVKYLTTSDQCIVALMIFSVCCGLWRLAHFKLSALFVTAAYTAAFILLVFLALGGPDGAWTGRADILFVWRHTAAPVLCAAVVGLVVKALRVKKDGT